MTSLMSRFACPSSSLRTKALLERSRGRLGSAVAVAAGIHLLLTQLGDSESQAKVVKPLTTQFVKRQPRLTKPLELKKRPQPKRRQMQRKMVSVKARVERRETDHGIQSGQMVRSLARPQTPVSRSASLTEGHLEPQAIAQAIIGFKEARQAVDMGLELMDLESLDTGRYHALVVQDPHDKRSLRGFCRLGVIYSDNVYGVMPESARLFATDVMGALLRLVDSMNRYTDIKTQVFGRITLESAEIFKTPWVYFMAHYGFLFVFIAIVHYPSS